MGLIYGLTLSVVVIAPLALKRLLKWNSYKPAIGVGLGLATFFFFTVW